MADAQIGQFDAGFTNRQQSQGQQTQPVGVPANYWGISSARARLNTKNAAYYTAIRMNQMTVNDLLYALRIEDDPTTI